LAKRPAPELSTHKVFVVHGHDAGAREAIARFLERIELEAIILHEQPDQGLTIIEKFETYATQVGFAVVLLTPDDLGGQASSPAQVSRARQNVIFELGYFAGKLGRGRTCLLRKGDVEIPSDLWLETQARSGAEGRRAEVRRQQGIRMNQLIAFSDRTPALVAAVGERASYRFFEFFTANIRNPNTRRAYARAAKEFFEWLAARGVTRLTAIESVHVAAYVEQLQKARSAPTAKLRLAALRHLFDWMVIGQIMPFNPAAAVRGPRHIVRRGKTPVLDPLEARQLIDAINISTVIGLRDRALIGLMVYSFARIGAAIAMRVEDVYPQNRRLWVRLHEKGGKQHAMPCHHNLETYLHEYLGGAGLADDPKAMLFQTYSRATGQLTGAPLPQANAYAMIQRRAKSADIVTRVGNHTFRATGVTAYLKNGGTLERAAQMANHASTRTTQLYDRRAEEVTLDEVERILV
jgi:site-specific recombinase XerD